jgi:myo-inositol-1(or 4)-monophosphatase
MSREEPLHNVKLEELKEIYDFALCLGRSAGQILLDGIEKRCGEESARVQGQEEKDSAVDIVTQADLGVSFCPIYHKI